MAESSPATTGFWRDINRRDFAMPLVLVGILALMILPLPTVLLDSLLAVNITLSLVILLTAIQVRRTLDFSVFPSMLLITTLFRLALNVSTTRLILLNGEAGTSAAGNIIQTFGDFVVRGNIVVGIVIFLILTLINFVVITKGSGRIAEVSARFTLDALPGKQMSIDSDLAAGLVTQDEARRRRSELAQETDFYGAMDGASKFVRGDAIAGLLITGINIIGGLIIGVAQLDMDFGAAAQTFMVLTIGDGLVTQIPTLLVSTAAGVVVTRAGDDVDLGRLLGRQVLHNRKVLLAAALIVAGIALVPGMPVVPFIVIIGTLTYLARGAAGLGGDESSKPPPSGSSAGSGDGPGPLSGSSRQEISDMLPIEALELEVGYALVPLVDTREDGEIAKRITGLRRSFARELGIILPPVHLKDNLDLGPSDYRLLVHGVEVARGSVMADRLMAMDPGDIQNPIEGLETVEPAFGLPALWIRRADRARAELAGYTVVEPPVVIVTHVSEVLQREAYKLVGRDGLQQLLDVVAQRSPKVVEELIPTVLVHAELLAVVRGLLRERVSVRNLGVILETLAEAARHGKATHFLVDQVRLRLGPAIVQSLAAPDGKLYAGMLDAQTEDLLRASLVRNDAEVVLAPDMATAQQLLVQLKRANESLNARGHAPVIVAPSDLRFPLWRFANRFLPQLNLLAQGELPASVSVVAVATVALTARPQPARPGTRPAAR